MILKSLKVTLNSSEKDSDKLRINKKINMITIMGHMKKILKMLRRLIARDF